MGARSIDTLVAHAGNYMWLCGWLSPTRFGWYRWREDRAPLWRSRRTIIGEVGDIWLNGCNVSVLSVLARAS